MPTRSSRRAVAEPGEVRNGDQGGERLLALLPAGLADRVRALNRRIQGAPSGVERVKRALKALPEMDRLVAAHPDLSALSVWRGFFKRVGNLYAEAVDELGRGAAAHPAEPQVHFWRATALGATGRFEEAVRALDAAVALAPNCAEYYKLRGQAREKAGDLEAAARDFEASLRCDPKYDWAYIGRSMVRVREGRLEDALEDLDHAIELGKREEWAYLKRSLIKRELGDLRGAVEDAVAACRINPVCDWVDGKMPMHEERLAKALAQLERLLKEEPRHAWAQAWRGQTLLKLERFREAEAALDAALKGRLGAGKGWVLAWRGEVRRRLGRSAEADADFARALKLCPDYPRAYFWRAAMRLDEGRAKDALKDLTACARRYDRSPEIQLLLGDAHERLGRREEALACYSLGLRMDPSGGELLKARARVRRALGDSDGAVEDLAAYYAKISIAPQSWRQAWDEIAAAAGAAAERVWLRLPLPLEVRLAQASALLGEGDARAALRVLDHARGEGESRAELHELRGRALRKLDALPEAVAAFKAALQAKTPGAAEKPPETPRAGPPVWVDERFELLGAVQRALEPASAPEWARREAPELAEFACDAQNHFGAHARLPELARLSALRQPPRAYRWFPLAKLLLKAGPVPELRPRSPLEPRLGEAEALDALRSFAAKSGFMDFIRERRGRFESWARPGLEALLGEDFRASVSDYLGVELRADYGMIVSVLCRDTAYSDEIVTHGGWTESRTIVCALDEHGELWRGADALERPLLLAKGWHELCHTAMDPWIEGYAREARAHERLYARLGGVARRTGWLDSLSEHLVLAPSVRLARHKLGPEAAARVLEHYERGGYAFIGPFSERLERFEARRASYGSLSEFYPEWLEVLERL